MSNPDNFVEHRRFLMQLSVQVPALTAAWRITGARRYADHAVRHLQGLVRGRRDPDQPEPAMRPGDSWAIYGARDGDYRHDPSGGGGAGGEVARAAQRSRPGEAVVRGVRGVDDHASLWTRRARRQEQSRRLLGDAGGGIRAADGEFGAGGVLSRALPQSAGAGPDRRRRQLPAGTQANQT